MQMTLLPCPLSIVIDGVRSSQPPSSGQTAAAVQAGFLFRFTLLLQLFVLWIALLLGATNLIVGSFILIHANHISSMVATVSCFSGLRRYCTASGFPFQVHAVAAVVCAADSAAAGCHQPHCWQLDVDPC